MLIKELAQQTGVSAKTIRYYESIGLLPEPKRGANNYREYEDIDVERLRFIQSSRRMNYSLADIKVLLAMREASALTPHIAGAAVDEQIANVNRQIIQLSDLLARLLDVRQQIAQLPQDQPCGSRCCCFDLLAQMETKHEGDARNE